MIKFVTALFFLLTMTAVAAADPATWAKVLGEKGTAVPAALAKAKRDMSPEEAGKIYPGAEQVSKYGFAYAAVKDIPGVVKLKFSFQPNKTSKQLELKFVSLELDPAILNDKARWDDLLAALVVKYGPVKKPEMIEKKIITWVAQRKVVQLAKIGNELSLKAAL